MPRQLLLAFDTNMPLHNGVAVANASPPRCSEDQIVEVVPSTFKPRLVATLNEATASVAMADVPRTSHLVRPDRQFTFDGLPVDDWPEAMHNPESITIDRPRDDIDGPAHRFLICCGDRVEVLVRDSAQGFRASVGTFLEIDHVRNRVLIQRRTAHDSVELWSPVESVFPAANTSPTNP